MSKHLRLLCTLHALLLAGPSLLAQPKINSFSPASGPAGTTVMVSGSGFNAMASGNLVYFGAVRAQVTSASATSLTVTVPAGATYQPVLVVNTANYQTAYAALPFVTTFINPYRASLSGGFYKPRIDLATGSAVAPTTAPFFVTSGDLNGDGKPEIVAVNASAKTVTIMRNAAIYGNLVAAAFGTSMQLPVGNDPRAAAIGDINADGKPDIVVVNSADETVSVLINTTTTASIGDITFASKVDVAVGSSPLSVAIQDVNGDGKPDVMVANLASNTISVLRNIFVHDAGGTNFFSARVDFPAGTAPRAVVVADLDGDKKVDLAVVNEQSNMVSVLQNTSVATSIDAASFAAPVNFATGTNPGSLAAGDLDGDDKTDLVVTNFASGTVSVLRNTAVSGTINAASFAAKTDYSTGSEPYAITIGDADGDGKPELIVANPTADKISILKNTSTAGTISASSFAAPTLFATDAYPVSVALGDLDGDGEPELLAANAATNDVSVLAFFPPGAPRINSFNPASGAAGTTVTITGSGFNPVAASNTVYFGIKKATVISGTTSTLTVTVPVGATYQPLSILNNLSALAAYSAKPFATTFANPFGTGIPADFYKFRVDFNVAANNTYGVAFSDLDGDGKTDLLGVNENANTLSVLSENGSGGIYSTSFSTKTDFPLATGPRAVAVHDMNGDGAPDVVTLSPAVNYIGILRNTKAGPPVKAASLAPAGGVDMANHVSSFAVGDLDQDGRPDLVVTNQSLNSISVMRNITAVASATVLFAYRVDFAAGDNPRAVAISDVDGDGKPDILVSNERSNNVSVFRNLAVAGVIDSSSFAAKVEFAAGTNPNSIVAGDIDLDGKTDIIVANYGSNTVSVLRNTATAGPITNASFAPKVDFATGENPFSLAIGDADGDGRVDLVTANSTANTLSVLRNTGTTGSITNASFAAKADFIAGGYPVNVTIGDLDGDSIPEITSASVVSGSISVWKTGPAPTAPPVPNPGNPSTGDSTFTIQLYPNPTKGVATLLLSGLKESVVNLDIFTANGKFIERRTVRTTGRVTVQLLNLRNQPAGIYYVKVTSTAGVHVEKMVVQR